MKEFFGKIWAWVLKNKVVSIVIASVLTVGITCSIVLPIALKHKHEFGTEFKSNETHHWLECECGEQQDIGDHTEKTAYSINATHHWKECEVCGYNMNVTAHTYDKQVANSTYFKEEQSTKSLYYKSCVCGAKGTDTFEVAKTTATLTNVALNNVEIVYGSDYGVNFSTNSNGAVTYEWYNGLTLLDSKPTDAGNNYKVKVKIAGNATYTPVESELISFEIKPYKITGLTAEFPYNGTIYQFIYLEDINPELRLDITFNSENVGATPTGVSLTIGGQPATNYEFDTTTCTASVVKKMVEVVWTAPNLAFDKTEKEPTAEVLATDLCGGDTCDVVIIKKDGNNIKYGSTFNYEATGLSNDNYDIIETYKTSPTYTIGSIGEIEVDELIDLGLTTTYGTVLYSRITLSAGLYVLEFDAVTQGFEFSARVYETDGFTEIVGKEFSDEGGFVVLDIETAGEYLLAYNQVTDSEPQNDSVKIYVDTHETPDSHGFCDKGCGTYLGEELDTNGWIAETLEPGEKVYYRFEEGEDVQYKISYYGSNGDGLIISCYRIDNNGDFVEISLSETATTFDTSQDGYYYLSIVYSALVTAPDKEFTFQIEELNN